MLNEKRTRHAEGSFLILLAIVPVASHVNDGSAVVRQAKAQRSLLWADEFAARIVSSTPLDVRADDISQQISRVAAGAGVPVTVMGRSTCVKSSVERYPGSGCPALILCWNCMSILHVVQEPRADPKMMYYKYVI